VQISSGELSHLLIENKELFHREEDALLAAGFQVSGYINVDDTGARPDQYIPSTPTFENLCQNLLRSY
jgi:hypothetical protein